MIKAQEQTTQPYDVKEVIKKGWSAISDSLFSCLTILKTKTGDRRVVESNLIWLA